MSVSTAAARHHAGHPQPPAHEALLIDHDGDDDIWTLPLTQRRPGPQPHNAGITPGFSHLHHADKPVTRGEYAKLRRRLRSELEDAVRTLAGRDAGQEAEVAALKAEVMRLAAERAEFEDAIRTLAARFSELEAGSETPARRPGARRGGHR